MAFWKKFFKTPSATGNDPKPSLEIYQGFEIVADPMREGALFRLAGSITRNFDGKEHKHVLIRADLFSSREEAVEAVLRKARLVIDEQGNGIFRDR